MKIGIFTDTHYCGLETLEQGRKPKKAYEAVRIAYEEFRNNSVDIVVCLGDLVHYNEGQEESKSYLKEMSELIRSFGIPTVVCMGNHDNEVLSAQEFMNVSQLRTAPHKVDSDDVRLIFLDASYYSDSEPYGRNFVDWTKSYVPQKELLWFDDVLNTEKKCIVFIHQNLDINVEKNHIVSNADEVNGVIAKHGNVCAVYQGHFHQGAENYINKIPYITQRAMCIGDEINFRIIEV